MRNKGRQTEFIPLGNLNGGLMTRPTPLVIEAGAYKRMPSPALRNVDFFSSGGIDKRLGKTQQGDAVVSSTYASQTSEDQTISVTASGADAAAAIGHKFTTVGAGVISSVDLKVALSNFGGESPFLQAFLYTDSGGNPGTIVTNGSSQQVAAVDTTTPYLITFTFAVPPSLSAGTDYWIIVYPSVGSADAQVLKAKGTSGSLVKTATNFTSPTWTAPSPGRDIYFVMRSTSSSTALQGVYDFRYASASTQKIMAAMGGALYYHARNATPLTGAWTSVVTGLGSGQDNLWSFSALKDYLFTCDYGNNASRVWNGSASATSPHGYRPTGTFARSATGGSLANGVYKVLMVTTLTSGGFRASTVASVTATGGGTDKIAASSVAIDAVAAQFGFDIGSTATTVFMTVAGGSIYYKLASASVSTSNPLANTDTAFNITAAPAGTENTLLDEYGLPQEYFTNQIATPTGKYLAVFNNFLCLAGDSTYPRRVWFSELSAPQIWSTYASIYGNFIDIGDADDNEPLIGIFAWGEYLYALKRHSVYVISYTGNASAPFQSRNISRGLGCLSHWSCKALGSDKFVFMSERGPAECFGTVVRIIPAAKNILDRFDANNSGRYNLAAMQYTTAGHNSTKMQVWWGVSSTSATTRDLTLVYDYENEAFWENDVSANFYAEITDSNFFSSVWSGDYSAQVFQQDNGTNDDGSAIDFFFETPWLQNKKPFSWKHYDHLFVSGTVQASGTLYADVYFDFSSSISYTRTFSMSDSRFKAGMVVPLGARAKAMKVRVRNSELDVPVHIDAIGFGIQPLGLSV